MSEVLFVSHSAELNGAELWLLETLRGLSGAKVRPVLAVPGPGRLEEGARAAGIETVRAPLHWWITEKSRRWRQPAAWILNRRAAGVLFGILKRRRFDLVFSNSAAVAAGALAARRAGVPHVWAIHEILRGESAHLFHWRGGRHLVGSILRLSRRVIVNSAATRACFPPSEKIVVVPNGVSPRRADPDVQAALAREFGLAPGGPVLGTIGKLYPGKGQLEAVRAAAALAPEFPGLRMLVVGDTGAPAYAAAVREAAAAGGIADRVRFVGWRAELPEILGLLSVVVIASTVESFGRVALDAMAAGTPVAAVRAGGLAEIVRDGENGLLVASREPAALAGAVRRILSDPDLARRLRQGGARTVASEFSLEAQIRGVAAALNSCLER